MEFYRKFRPNLFKHVIGQGPAVRALTGMLKDGVPHAICLMGESGTGKTTLARIMAEKMGCLVNSDLYELNAAKERGIDMVRNVDSMLPYFPTKGSKCRIWILDECHALTKDAQTALLKILEDPPDQAYFFLCTSAPTGLLPTIRSRCRKVQLKPLDQNALAKILKRVCDEVGKTPHKSVIPRILEAAHGNARDAVNILENVLHSEGKEEQMAAVVEEGVEKLAIDLCRFLCNKRPDRKGVMKILRDCKEDPEKVRRAVLGYASKMVRSNHPASEFLYRIIICFESNFFDSGDAGLTRACWEACLRK